MAKRVFTVPPNHSFADALARGLLARWGDDPLMLSRALVLLPTRRACRNIQQAFLRASQGRALLLPQLMPLGDLDPDELLINAGETLLGEGGGLDLPPALPPMRRQLLLSQLVLKWAELRPDAVGMSEDQAVRLAGELGRLLDQVQTEGLDFAALIGLVPEDYAAHWQVTLEFLEILTKTWPAIEEELGAVGAAERRRLLLNAQVRQWRDSPPDFPVVVAGSTGSIPAVAELIDVVAGLPEGMVVLPGLDCQAGAETWDAIRRDPSHPQCGLARLLATMEVPREEVGFWPGTGGHGTGDEGAIDRAPQSRVEIVQMAMRPAQATTEWQGFVAASDADYFKEGMAGVTRIDCPGSGEEALTIAMLLRSVLEEPDRTAALITPDRDLARRVSAELARWGVQIDDSAGSPLPESAPAVFLRLTAEAVAANLAPLELLAALKHPLAAGGISEGAFKRRVRALEMAVLRGVRPAPGFDGLLETLGAEEKHAELRNWVVSLKEMATPFLAQMAARRASLADLLEAHLAFAEALAASEEQAGAERLWSGEEGSAVADFSADLLESADAAPRVEPHNYPQLLTALMIGRVVRQPYGAHPRLSILGTIEARLQHCDVLVLGGLNEGTWPAEAKPGPWMSRPMRRDFGLPQPEQHIGLSAQDFSQAFCAPRVYLTRAEKVEGAPTVPSRWLLRLEALLEGKGLKGLLQQGAEPWLSWVEKLDEPEMRIPSRPPAPTPPVEARPRELSVTRIETWMRDPYALYAQKILNLKKLDPLDADPSGADKGSLIHKALEDFSRRYPDALPEDAEQRLLAIGEEIFAPVRNRPGIWSFWWPRFQRIAKWFLEQEQARRQRVSRSHVEVSGRIEVEGPAGPFAVTAKADRIDELAEGGLAILDYKTGSVPSAKNVLQGISPQLPLEAAIAEAGGFRDVPEDQVRELLYWRLSGGDPAGEEKNALGQRGSKKGPGEIAREALEGLRELIAEFDRRETPYVARPRPKQALTYNDYEHLARIKEWASGGEDGA